MLGREAQRDEARVRRERISNVAVADERRCRQAHALEERRAVEEGDEGKERKARSVRERVRS